jgi:hypothetical protein
MDQSFSELLKMDKCSPFISYVVMVIVTGITIYNVRTELNKLGNNNRVKNINDMFMWYEVALVIIVGVVMYGLCQYNESTLAWILLFVPIIAVLSKTVIVFLSVSNAQKLVPADAVSIPGSSMDPQQALISSIQQQAAMQVPRQGVMASHKLGTNEQPGLAPPLNKASSISSLDAMGTNAIF